MKIDKKFYQISEENSEQIVDLFNRYIDEIYSLNELDDLSLLSSITQRNTFTSKLFPYINKIFVFNKLRTLENKKPIEDQIFKRTSTLPLKIKFYFFILFWTLAKNFLPKKKKNVYKNNLFLEIFENGNDKKELGSHYYPDLQKKLPPETNNICFLVNALNINTFFGVYRLREKLLNSNFDYIFYDTELGIRALDQYFKDCKQINKGFINIPNFLGFNMKSVIANILEEEKYSRTNLLANIKYRKFLEDDHYNKKSTILLWNENHSFDRALCLANKKRREKLNLVGHAGYIESKEKNCLNITKNEKIHQISPKKIFKLFKTECEVEYGHAPAFRYDSFFREKKSTELKENVTIAFPLPKNEIIIFRLIKIAQQLEELKVKFEYNLHPLLPNNYKILIKKNLKQAPSNEKLEDLLHKSKILISSGLSGVYLDAFFCRTPSINVTKNKNIDNDIFIRPAKFTDVDHIDFGQYYFIIDEFPKIKQLIDNPPIISMAQKDNLKKAFIIPSSLNIINFFNDVKNT